MSPILFFCFLLLISFSNNSPTCPGGPGVFAESANIGSSTRCVYYTNSSPNDCNTQCAAVGQTCSNTDLQTLSTQQDCESAAAAFNLVDTATPSSAENLACYYSGDLFYSDDASNVECSATLGTGQNVCICGESSSSAGEDPHFFGLNGEKLDIVKDPKSSNKIFSIFCDLMVKINALFSPNPENLLFMTEFAGRVGDVLFSLKLGKYPQFYGNYFTQEVEGTQNRTRFLLEAATIESDGSGMIIKTDTLEIMIQTASDVEGNVYFDIDIKALGEVRREASGIIGRTFERKYSDEEFSEYYQFMLQAEDDKFNACPGDNGRF